MSNPFGTTETAPAAAKAADPFASKSTPAPSPAGGDPFGQAPDAPAIDGITKDDAKAGAVVILKIVKVDSVRSKFPTPGTDDYPMQDRLTVDAVLCNAVNGKEPGTKYEDMWIHWNRVVRQFKECAGNGKPYLVRLSLDGQAVAASEVTDPAMRAEAAKYL